jgi:hypothetical protein
MPDYASSPTIPTIPEALINPIKGKRNSSDQTCPRWETCEHEACIKRRHDVRNYEHDRGQTSYGGRSGDLEKRMKVEVLRGLLKERERRDRIERENTSANRQISATIDDGMLEPTDFVEKGKGNESENWWTQYAIDDSDAEERRRQNLGVFGKIVFRRSLGDIPEDDELDG